MISPEKHEKILQAKADGLEVKEIVQLVGVSRASVNKYMGIKKVHRKPKEYHDCYPYICPTCRNRVVLKPCVICEHRSLLK